MQPLYMQDSYLREFTSKVKSVKDNKFIVLEQTAFYPNSGGQPNDTGIIKKDNQEFKVIFVGKFDSQISHEVDQEGLKEGDEVTGIIDWDRRYKLMRMHSAAHVMSAVLYQETGALITGNQLDTEKSRIDFNLENFDREKLQEFIQKANEVIKQNLNINVKFMPRQEVEKDPSLQKLAKGLPPGIETFRIIEIENFDIQADGGTHVKNTQEIGEIEFLKAENKGAQRRRVYFKLK
ncbi:MAG: alanyl-tRNA editing protein [Nanoarchaeota archaeon]|nr:alanyl-tRNA editing protein [Nanoarchaeota archaeon]